MVDDVEIKNVGGKYGVASEATMQLILSQLGGAGSGAGSRAQRLADASLVRSTRANNDAASSQGILTKTFKGTIGAVDGLATAIFKSGNKISEFSQSLLGDGNMLFRGINRLTAYVDDSMDSLRELSSVGASFNNSIFDMKLAATAGEMSFIDFSMMVRENSATLAMLGGTVSKGAEQISLFTKGIRKSDAGKQLMGMGFTIASINEGLVDYLTIQMQSGNKINLRDKKLMTGGEAYLKQLDELAKITGKSRDEISKGLIAQQQDAGIRNRTQQLTGEAQTNFTSTLEYINSTLPAFAPGLKDMMDGVAQTDMGKLLTTQIQGLGPLMERVYAGQISEVDFNTELKKLQPQIDKFQSQYSKEMIDALRQGGGIGAVYAEAADAAYQLNTALNQSTAELDKERDQRNKLTTLFGNFNQTIETARSNLYTAFVTSPAFKALEDLGLQLLGMVTPGTGTMDTFSAAIDYISEFMLGKDGVLTKAIQFVSTQIDSFAALVKEGGFLNAFQTKLTELGTWMSNWFKDLFYGKQDNSRDRQGENQKGLFAKIGDGMLSAFESFWEGPYGKAMSDKIIEYFSNVTTEILDTIALSIKESTGLDPFGRAHAAQGRVEAKEVTAGAETSTTANIDAAIEASKIEGSSAFGAATAKLSRYESKVAHELQTLKSATELNKESPGKYDNLIATTREMLINELKVPEAMIPEYKTGTSGFENFGTESPAMLHGVEAVVPKNTMAGSMLAKTFGDDWNSPKAGPVAQQSQENNGKYIIQLNTTMLMVLEELRKGNDLEKRTLNSVKNLSGDLYRGI